MPRRPDLKCNLCGELKWRGTTSLPEGQYRCQPCRRIAPLRATPQQRKKQYGKPALCAFCEDTFPSVQSGTGWTRYCSRDCYLKARYPAPAKDPYYRRALRVPGLTAHKRAALLAKWKRVLTRCAYCNNLADTVDHVVPIARGGTNYEGNLVPCCRSCNGRKGARLLMEWRLGRRWNKAQAAA